MCYNLRQLFKFFNLRQPVFTFYDSFGTDCFLHFTTGLLQFTTSLLQFTTFFTIYENFYNLRQHNCINDLAIRGFREIKKLINDLKSASFNTKQMISLQAIISCYKLIKRIIKHYNEFNAFACSYI